MALEHQAQPVGLMVSGQKAVRLPDHERPPCTIFGRDDVVFWRNQVTALEAPTGPSRAGKLQPGHDAQQLVDGIRDAVRAVFPVMPSAFGDLKVFRGIGGRPAQVTSGRAQAKAKLGAVIGVMGAGFPMLGAVTVLYTMYIMLSHGEIK